MMLVRKPKQKSKKKKKKQKKTKEENIQSEEKNCAEMKQEQKLNEVEVSTLSQYNINRHCTQLIWCEVSNRSERYLNFMKLYHTTSKDITMKEIFKHSMLKYVNKSYFEENYKYNNIKHDVNAFCVLLWTSSDCHTYKKTPKGSNKQDSFPIHKYLQKSLLNDDATGLELSIRIIRGINNTINNHPTNKQLIGYHGSKMSVEKFAAYEVNQDRRIAMYVACSMNKQIADEFIGTGCVLVTVIIPRGCLNARVIPSPMSMFPHEVEILIPPYSLFKCIGKKESVRNFKFVREVVLLLIQDNQSEKFDGFKNVPYWTA